MTNVMKQSAHQCRLAAVLLVFLGAGLLAAPVFASSVTAIPMLVDRQVSVGDAVLASWRTVLENPVPMGVWAVLVTMRARLRTA